MHRDMKVGMALGVALVGIVGALFFRRDPVPPEPAPPALKGVDEIDKRIVDKPKMPYLQGLDEDVEPAAPSPAPSVAKARTKTTAYELPGFLTSQDEAEHRAVLTSKQTATPDPIVSPASREVGPRPVSPEPPPHNRGWEPVESAPLQAAAPAPPAAARPEPAVSRRTHVIQAGDTLSSLAGRYLGSTARFREIYDANRNVLRSPDDLPDGVTLVIPEGKPATSAAPPAQSAETVAPRVHKASVSTPTPPAKTPAAKTPAAKKNEPAVSGEVQSGRLRFAPVNRGSLSAGRASAAGEAALPPSRAPDNKSPSPRLELEEE